MSNIGFLLTGKAKQRDRDQLPQTGQMSYGNVLLRLLVLGLILLFAVS
jgi:LPXTG-motif cell wall-anchored protein